MAKGSLNKHKTEIRKNISAVDRVGVNFNLPCQTVTSQVPQNNGHIIRIPHVVPIMWGHFYVSNPSYQSAVKQMITDLVTRSYMNGHAQYGVQRGSVNDPINIDTNPSDPDPTNLSREDIQTNLVNWISNGTVTPAPEINEKSLVYIIFLPLGSTFGGTDNGFWGYRCPNVSSPCTSSKFNPSSSDNDLFWAVIITNPSSNSGINTSSATSFVNTTAFPAARELTEAFTDRDGNGFMTNSTMTVPGCEICDICGKLDHDPTTCCDFLLYKQN